jgi:hypothetical protein
MYIPTTLRSFINNFSPNKKATEKKEQESKT